MTLQNLVNTMTAVAFNTAAHPLISQLSQAQMTNPALGVVSALPASTTDANGITTLGDVGTASNNLTDGSSIPAVVGARVIRNGDVAPSIGGRLF